MGHSVAVMNTKGGVGKSTIVMALAETLAVHHGKNILVVDSDSQTSMSTMLMHVSRWEEIESRQRTLVDFLNNQVLGPADAQWRDYVAVKVSDVEDADTIYLLPSHMELSLFEREISAQKKEKELRAAIRAFLADAGKLFDIVLIDCPPGLSILTECWLRECDYFMPPTKPDYLAVRGLAILKRFRQQHSEQGFAKLLGVLINLKDGRISTEDEWHKRLRDDPENNCFEASVPRRSYIQRAADFDPNMRTFIAKYPGDAGLAVKALAAEFLGRLAGVAAKVKPKAEAVVAAKQSAPPRPVAAAAKPMTPASPIKFAAPRPVSPVEPQSAEIRPPRPLTEPGPKQPTEARPADSAITAGNLATAKPAAAVVAASAPPVVAAAVQKPSPSVPKPAFVSAPVSQALAGQSMSGLVLPLNGDAEIAVDLVPPVPAKPVLPRPVPPPAPHKT